MKNKLDQRAEVAENANMKLTQALSDALTPGAISWEKHGEVSFGVSRLTGAMGGLFITKFIGCKNDRAHVTVEYLDEAIAWSNTYPGILTEDAMVRRSAIEHATVLRSRRVS